MNNFNQINKLTIKEIHTLVEAGGTAPSGGNMQPWYVKVKKNTFDIYIDKKRSSTFLDVNRFASIFSIGCFVENLCITADTLGLTYKISELKNNGGDNYFVSVAFLNRTAKKANTLYHYIFQRLTNRKLHEGTLIDQNIITRLNEVIKRKNDYVKFYTIHNRYDKTVIGEILGKADAIRMTNLLLFKEMLREIRWTQAQTEQTQDGIDIETMELPPNGRKIFQLMSKYPIITKVVPRKAFENIAKPLIINSSHMCCISITKELTPQNIFEAGRSMQKLWLTATSLDVKLHPWTILPFLLLRVTHAQAKGLNKKEARNILLLGKQVRSVFKIPQKETPLFIFRLSQAKQASARALRRSWESYTEIV